MTEPTVRSGVVPLLEKRQRL